MAIPTYTSIRQMLKEAAEYKPFSHTIKRGDTLEALGSANGVSMKRLNAANPGIEPTKLRIGQQITIPVPDWYDIKTRTGFDPRNVTTLSPDTIKRMRFVESSNGKRPFNKETNAIGSWQIKPIAYTEALRINPLLKRFKHTDLYRDDISRLFMSTLTRKWASDWQFKHEKPIPEEVLVRMWHRGPSKYELPQAYEYANKVYGEEAGKYAI